jgi:[acyl-carrier-protein] S-malonyltransferase
VAAVNFNSPGQVVIAGTVAAVDSAIGLCKEAGAKRALPLPVSAPFHTELMRPAGEKLAEVLAGIAVSAPEIPVIHNVHAQAETDPARIRELLVEQISSPVQWAACVNGMVTAGISRIVECGPGKVLSGLNRRIDKSLQSFTIEQPADLESTLAAISGGA